MPDELPEIETVKYRIALVPFKDGWCWLRNDSKRVSPVFSTAEAAYYFAGKIPFLSDDEWKTHNPLPQEIWEVLKTKGQTP